MDQIFGTDRHDKKTKPNKIWGSKMRVLPKWGPLNSNFLTFYAGQMKFLS